MTDRNVENAFVVISGSNPQIGKKERIRQVRSHITKGYYRKQGQEQQQRRQHRRQNRALIPAAPSPSPSSSTGLVTKQGLDLTNNSSSPPLMRELYTPISFTTNRFLDPVFLGAEMTKRIQQFFDTHMQTNTNRAPQHSNVLRWAVTTPYYTSAKLLQASGWDDVQDSGELSEWTARQRCITVRLLDDAFATGAKLEVQATVSTVLLLLSFELLAMQDANFCRLKDFCHSLIERSAKPDENIWSYFVLGLDLLDHANCLRMASGKKAPAISSPALPSLQFQPEPPFIFPMDLSLFTFGQTSPTEDNHLVYTLLGDFYHVISIAARCQQRRVSRSTYDHVVSQRRRMQRMIANIDAPFPLDDEEGISARHKDRANPQIAPLQQSIFLITSCLLYGVEGDQKYSLSKIASRLRSLFMILGTEWEHHVANLRLFPGSLVWCYAIGVRFSNPECDQKWFLVKFLSTTHAWMVEAFDELSKNVRMIVDCMKSIRQLSVEGID